MDFSVGNEVRCRHREARLEEKRLVEALRELMAVAVSEVVHGPLIRGVLRVVGVNVAHTGLEDVAAHGALGLAGVLPVMLALESSEAVVEMARGDSQLQPERAGRHATSHLC